MIWQALSEANREHAPSYGTDEWSARATELFRQELGDPLEVFFVFNGTGANVLALSGLLRPYETVLCAATAHLNIDECGAPELSGHFKLQPVTTADGKLRPEDIERAAIRGGDQHFAQLRAVSLTQPTEFGTLYTLEELKALVATAHQHRLFIHIDGARFILAAAQLDCSLRQLSRDIGIDVLSFGGTKNGLLMGEAVLVFRPELREHYKFLRKQMMQLPSKTRFIGAQFSALLTHGLWRQISEHSCQMATRLASGLKEFTELEFTHPVQTNAVFVKIPKHYVSRLREHYFFYIWNEQTFEARLMTSFDTTADDVDTFVDRLRQITKDHKK